MMTFRNRRRRFVATAQHALVLGNLEGRTRAVAEKIDGFINDKIAAYQTQRKEYLLQEKTAVVKRIDKKVARLGSLAIGQGSKGLAPGDLFEAVRKVVKVLDKIEEKKRVVKRCCQ